MTYVFDTNSLIVLFTYFYRQRFPTLWQRFDQLVGNGTITSVSEVRNEIDGTGGDLSLWAKTTPSLFPKPSMAEMHFVADIFRVPHFQYLIGTKQALSGRPVADPFVVARAGVLRGCVVTQEANRPNAAKIPNVCDHFGVDCCGLEGFMERENWTF